MAEDGPLIMTVGHSTRPLGEFLDLLEQHDCRTVIDVRSLPRSRRYPHFDRAAIASSLGERGIGYRHCAALGGLRRPLQSSESKNRGLRNERFRAYADHMQTTEFADAVARLVELAGEGRCAVMCAEAVPWRCHRSLLADALVARGCRVLHVIDSDRAEWHRLHEGAVVAGGRVSYPADPQQQRLDRAFGHDGEE